MTFVTGFAGTVALVLLPLSVPLGKHQRSRAGSGVLAPGVHQQTRGPAAQVRVARQPHGMVAAQEQVLVDTNRVVHTSLHLVQQLIQERQAPAASRRSTTRSSSSATGGWAGWTAGFEGQVGPCCGSSTCELAWLRPHCSPADPLPTPPSLPLNSISCRVPNGQASTPST